MRPRPLEECEPFLGNDDKCEAGVVDCTRAQLPWSGRRERLWNRRAIVFHVVLALCYSVVYVAFVRRAMLPPREDRPTIYSPAREAIEYDLQVFHSDIYNNPFVGEPRPELDEAWHDLLKDMHIRISAEDLEQIGETSLPLADGSGFVGSLEVFHDLHCLKRIRHWMYRDVYFANVSESMLERHRLHTEHCLEHLRELVMCRGDIALTTFFYREDGMAAKLLAEHECVNWDRIQSWMKPRAIDLSAAGIVVPKEAILGG